jgi:hypothetical protein
MQGKYATYFSLPKLHISFLEVGRKRRCLGEESYTIEPLSVPFEEY